MNNNLQENNNVVTEKNNNSKIIIVILVVLLIGALGFICYDKFINKEKPPVPTPSTTPEPTDNNKSITTLKEVKLTPENQTITIGNNNLNIRIESESDYSLYINDSLVQDNHTFNETDNTLYFSSNTVYVTDNYAFFIGYGQFDMIDYAIDSNGKEINVENNNYYIHDIHLDNGLIVGKGMTVTDALDEDSNAAEAELIVKYENNKITVTKK